MTVRAFITALSAGSLLALAACSAGPPVPQLQIAQCNYPDDAYVTLVRLPDGTNFQLVHTDGIEREFSSIALDEDGSVDIETRGGDDAVQRVGALYRELRDQGFRRASGFDELSYLPGFPACQNPYRAAGE